MALQKNQSKLSWIGLDVENHCLESVLSPFVVVQIGESGCARCCFQGARCCCMSLLAFFFRVSYYHWRRRQPAPTPTQLISVSPETSRLRPRGSPWPVLAMLGSLHPGSVGTVEELRSFLTRGAASKTAVRHMLRECFCENMCRCAIILRTQAVSKPMHVASSPESPRLLAWLLLERRRSPEGLGDLVERHGSKWILEAIIWGGSHNASTGKKDAAQRQNRRGCSSKSPLCHESWAPLSRAVASILSISLQTKRRGHGGMHGHGDGCLAIHKLFRGAFVQ